MTPVEPITVEEFFKTSWRGSGRVTTPFGRTLRAFSLDYRSEWSDRDSAFLIEETLTYDGGGALRRSWHLATDGEGAMLGLEATQGGRVFLEDTRHGFCFRYDRLKFLPGPNVANLRLMLVRSEDGSVRARGWTKALGVVPLVKTTARLQATATPPSQGDRQPRGGVSIVRRS